jgi:hypothetical protein
MCNNHAHRRGHAQERASAVQIHIAQLHRAAFEATIRGLKRQTGAKNLRQLGSYVSVIHWLAETWVQFGAGKMRKLTNAMKIVGRRKAEIADSSLEVLDQLDDPVKREKVKKLGDTIFAEFRAKGGAATRKHAATFRNALYWELGLMTGWRPSSRTHQRRGGHPLDRAEGARNCH